jgi:predicted nuclease of predicted toxin-antitoxin system
MRLLLDENLDWRLRRDLPEHQVESVPLIGWGELRTAKPSGGESNYAFLKIL